MYEPVIKWSGSKRSQAEKILQFFPKEIDTYYEPFCGGASVLRRLLSSDIKVNKYVCSDLNSRLIDLWNGIKNNPQDVSNHYTGLWKELNKDDNKQRKKDFFNSIRDRYNEKHNPLDFMFIMRTTTNGMPRYNNEGNFNNSFHITRNGITPDKLKKIICEWSELLNRYNVIFTSCSYEYIHPNKTDFCYFDPPFMGAAKSGRNSVIIDKLEQQYPTIFKCGKLWNWLRENDIGHSGGANSDGENARYLFWW